jgi:hypothetical protein
VLNRSLRKLCIALKALAEASAITVIRPAACNRDQEVQALTERTATTQAAITPMTALRVTDTVSRFSIRSPSDGWIKAGNRKLLGNWILICF